MNKVTLIGHLGFDADYKELPTGLTVTGLRVATNEKDKTGKEHTEWHSVATFAKLADACKFLKKGTMVYIEGKIRTDSYEKNGETRFATKIVAYNVLQCKVPTMAEAPSMNQAAATNVNLEELPF